MTFESDQEGRGRPKMCRSGTVRFVINREDQVETVLLDK